MRLTCAAIYPPPPPEEATDTSLIHLEQHKTQINTIGLGLTDIKSLPEHCLSNNHIRFGNSYFKQVAGIAMGRRIAPSLAILFMGALEEKFLNTSTIKPDIYM